MKYDLIIFDLDGTILNTLDDLANACNGALGEAGYPPRSTDDVRRFIGNGVARLIRLALPEGTSEEVISAVLARFKEIYIQNVNVHTKPYPGIPELVAALKARGVKLAVNSNKVNAATQLLCAAHFPELFDMVLGENPDIPRKPAPDGANRIMTTLGVKPERTLYVGDGDADIRTAQNAGIEGAWVSWGYRGREELTDLEIPRAFDTVEALRAYVMGE